MAPRLVSLLRPRARDERALIVRARENPELFAEFYEELYEQVLAFFAREVLDPDIAFDLAAETFTAAFDALEHFRGSTAAEGYAWLWTIARRQLFRWREVGRVERVAMTRVGVQLLPLSDVEFERAEELADIASRRDAVVEAMSCLKADQHEAVRLRVVDERPYDEIAAALGVTEQVVRARVSRGLRRLSLELDSRQSEMKDVAQ